MQNSKEEGTTWTGTWTRNVSRKHLTEGSSDINAFFLIMYNASMTDLPRCRRISTDWICLAIFPWWIFSVLPMGDQKFFQKTWLLRIVALERELRRRDLTILFYTKSKMGKGRHRICQVASYGGGNAIEVERITRGSKNRNESWMGSF